MEKTFQQRLAEEQSRTGLSQRLEPEIISPPNKMSYEQAIQLVKEKNLFAYTKKRIDLTNAQTYPVEFFGGGMFLYAIASSDDTANVDVIFSDVSADPVNFVKDYGWSLPFDNVFLKWAAQPGKWIELVLVPVLDLVQIFDNRKVSAISKITEVTSVPGLNGLPAGAVAVSGRWISNAGSGNSIVYTVTTGKTLYLTSAGVEQGGNATSEASELVHLDGASAFVRSIVLTGFNTANGVYGGGHRLNFTPPLVLGSTHKIQGRKRTTADGIGTGPTTAGFFHGYEI